MQWLDSTLGPMRVRAWGLILNFLCNACALTGLARYLHGEGGIVLMLSGGMGTLACIAVLAIPDKSPEGVPATGGRSATEAEQ